MTFEDTLVYVGLRRIVTVAFLRRVQIFLLTYLMPCMLWLFLEMHAVHADEDARHGHVGITGSM